MKFIEQQRVHIPAETGFVRRKFLDIPYAPDGPADYESKFKPQCRPEPPGSRRTLDIYLPNEGEGPYPVVLDIFGGGWCYGHKSSHKLEPALNLLRRGFAVVSINYSLSYQARFPVQVLEVKAAIRYVRKHAAEYQLDPDRIALLGESAGAHLAALSACSSATGELTDPSWPNQDVSDQVQAVIAVYCPVHLGIMKEVFEVEKQAWGLGTLIEEYGEADSMESILLGGAVKDVPDMVDMANPCSYLNEKCPPFLFLHGDKDQVEPIVGAMVFAAKIMHATSLENVQFQVVKGAHHDIHDFEAEWIYDVEAAFLNKIFNKGEKKA